MCSVLKVIQGYNQGVSQAACSFGGVTREESISKLIQVVGRIQFLAAVRLRSLFS